MDGMDFELLFAVFLLIFGVYLLFSAAKMKKTGQPGDMVLDEQEKPRCKDKKGMAFAIAGKMRLFGAVTVLCGGAGTVNCLTLKNRWIGIAGFAAFLATCFWFISRLRSVRDEYIR